jgi:hypothetical protein
MAPMSATVETDQSIGTTGRASALTVPPGNPVDTTNVGMVAAPPGGWKPTDTSMSGTVETTLGTVVTVQQKRTAPNLAGVPGNVADTTKTDSKVSDGLGATRADPNAAPMTGTLETNSVGAQAKLSTANVPVAPAAPTLVAKDRAIQVTFVAVADPASDAKVKQYEIESDTGGHLQVGANVTVALFTQVVPGQSYKFRVRALNANGGGPWSPFSASAAVALNRDEVPSGGLDPKNTVNPIYRGDGTIVQGSYGAPTNPGKPTVTAQGTAGTATVAWAASSPAPANGYDVKASTGQSAHVGGGVTTVNLPGLTVTNVITVTVTARGALQDAVSPASNSYTVV